MGRQFVESVNFDVDINKRYSDWRYYNMREKVFDELLEFLKSDKPVIRKFRVIRYICCVIIVFTFWCSSYWNILGYVNLPCVPLWDEGIRNALSTAGTPVVLIWIIYSLMYHNIYRITKKEYWLYVSFCDKVLDCLFTVFFLVYSVNVLVEYANGVGIVEKKTVILAVIYFSACIVKKAYYEHQDTFDKAHTKPTGFFDCNNQSINMDDLIIYKGQKNKVICFEGEYKLLPHDEHIISKKLVSLKEAAGESDSKIKFFK